MKKIISSILLICMCVMLSSCNKSNGAIATVNGEEISASLYNFYLTNIKQQLNPPANVDATEYWANTVIDGKNVTQYAKDKATDEAIKLVLIAQKAKEQGITITTEDKASIDKQKADTKTQAGGTDEQYIQMLATYGLTDATYAKMLEYTIYQNKLMEQMQSGYTADQIKNFYDNNMVNVKHVLILTVDPSSNAPLDVQGIAQKKVKADDVMAQIKNGGDFEKIQAANNEDTGSAPTGYTISKYSNMVEPFLSTSLALQVGQVSDIVQTSYGYHIIKRFEHKGNNEIFTAAQTEIKASLFWQDVDNWKNDATIKINQNEIDKIKLN